MGVFPSRNAADCFTAAMSTMICASCRGTLYLSLLYLEIRWKTVNGTHKLGTIETCYVYVRTILCIRPYEFQVFKFSGLRRSRSYSLRGKYGS